MGLPQLYVLIVVAIFGSGFVFRYAMLRVRKLKTGADLPEITRSIVVSLILFVRSWPQPHG